MATPQPSSIFGTIQAPPGVDDFVSSGGGGGLIVFINNMMIVAVIIGGLIALFNVLSAGYTYLTAGSDSKAYEKVVTALTNSLWGIALIILAPALLGIVGFVFFRDAMYFLSPNLPGV